MNKPRRYYKICQQLWKSYSSQLAKATKQMRSLCAALKVKNAWYTGVRIAQGVRWSKEPQYILEDFDDESAEVSQGTATFRSDFIQRK